MNNIRVGHTKAPNMRDVAAAAGVSLSTVSLVVNGKPGVAPDRRDRVLRTMKELGYVADSRRNPTMETKVFGILMESLSEASRSEGFYTRIVSGIEETAYELEYQVLLHVYRPDVDPLSSLRELMGREIDGLIIANDGDVTPQVIQKITEAGVPTVLVENDIPFDPSLQPLPVSGNPRKGYVQMQRLLSLPEPPTAVFAVSDRAALGAMDAIKDAGLRIPDDISVVGIDDVRDSAYSTPPLTTYSVPKYDLGRTAVFVLHELISGKAIPPCRTVLIGRMMERQSAGAPRK
jgi:DNA-binding LacI/PurR family transcriptional regulator